MKLTSQEIIKRKGCTPIAVLTAYSAVMAQYLELADIPMILVGDSVAMVELGFKATSDIDMATMCHHISAVRRGAPDTHIIGDMPYGSDVTVNLALKNAKMLIEAGADSVKIEGPRLQEIKAIVASGIDVVAHTGLLPQTAKNFKQVGRNPAEAQTVKNDAKALELSGCFAIVLEHIPDDLAQEITTDLSIPTIGIGAGNSCDGQVLVLNDMLGLSDRKPPFVKTYAQLGKTVKDAVLNYRIDVETRDFPNHG